MLAERNFHGSMSKALRKALSILKLIVENMGPGKQLMIVDKEGKSDTIIILHDII